MTDDLVAFLRARLDEDEQMAEAAADGDSGGWFVGDKWNVYRVEDETPDGYIEDNKLVVYGNVKAQSEHIARHNPGRTLGEVNAKRMALRHLLYAIKHQEQGAALAEEVIRTMAVLYCGHPDFNFDWAPDGPGPAESD